MEKSEHSIVNQLRFEKLVYGGDALARQEGRVIMTPFVLPGELAAIEPVQEKPGLVRGRLIEVVEKSPDRVEPNCRHFALCGGCHYQHAGYSFQLAQKVSILGEVLRRVGKIEPPGEIDVVSGPEWAYRNRIQLHIDGNRIGFYEAGSHRVRNIDQCPVASPKLNQSIETLRGMLRDKRWPNFLRGLELFTNEAEVQVNVLDSGTRHVNRGFFEWCAEKMPGAMASSLEYSAAGHLFRVSHQSFFQVNRFLMDQLVETTLAGVEGDSVVDLYAGVGLFSLAQAKRGSRVMAVESGTSAVMDLEHNAQRAGIELKAIRKQSEQFLETLGEKPDWVIADPPRAGLGKYVVRRLLDLKAPRITLVSCDPPTLARDVAALLAGGYLLEGMTLVDLFPHTAHMETVARLRLG
ncbi:MAG: class I SAM-dependent RNA methyltransferase [Acidobacteriia bacterium]|nr:class I SAM-dependent RNA methyltransferase [Terriglobia bacterium]